MPPLARRAARPTGWLFALALPLLAGLLPPRSHAADEARRTFALAAGGAEATLEKFTEQAGVQIVYLLDDVRGATTNPIHGEFSVREALDRLVAGTALAVARDGNSGAFVIKLTRAAPAPDGTRSKPPDPTPPTMKPTHTAPSPTPADQKPGAKTKRPFVTLAAWLALAVAPAAHAADGTGTIAGRVSNAATGVYLEKARITVEGTALETFTDEGGYYQLTQVSAGAAKVKAFFTGLPVGTSTVSVTPGRTAQHDIGLEGYPGGTRAGAASGAVVSLDKFVVSTSKEMDGAAIAINEQRFAPNIVNVVAADEFGSMAEGNVAEFMKFLPGITMNVGESGDANNVSINGAPSGNVPITVGGFDLASANQAFGTGTGREINLDQVSLNTIARIEVVYTPTPEITGSALAGSVNMVPRSAFERSRPLFTSSAFLMMRDSEKTFKKTPGPGRTPTRKIHPGFDFSYIVPVNKRFGFTVSGGTSTNYTTEDIIVRDWNGAGVATNGLTAPTAATQFPDTTPDRPYLSRFSFDLDTKVTRRASIGATLDFKLTPHDTVSFSFQYANNTSMTNGRRFNYRIQRIEPGDFSPTSVRGIGNTTVQGGDYDFNGTTYMPGLRYRHDGPTWKVEAGAGLSHGTSHIRDVAKGLFNSTIAQRSNLRLAFNDINYLRPATITVNDATTGAPVDPYSLANYSLSTGNTAELDGLDTKRSAFANLRRDFFLRVPVSVKAGLDLRQSIRDYRRENQSYSHVGADGRANTADDNAIVILDESVSQRIPPYGFPRTQWIDNVEYYGLYRANPGHFTTNEVTAYNNRAANSKYAEELISSAYFRGDLQLFERRLKLVGGVRAEQTNVKAEGRLLDPTLNYRRDAAGRVVLVNGTPQLIEPAGSLAAARLTTIDRGLKAKKEYLRWFPSLNASFNLRDNLIARAGHYWSVGRPNFSQYAGALNLPDTERPPATNNRISVANAGIKAWSAKTTKLTLEYYFERVGLVSVGVFRRDFENFFGATVFQATPEFLALYSLDADTYGDYEVTTQHNLDSRVRMSGVDFNYKQALTFLPHWARGVQVFANASAQRAIGEQSANFAGYVPRTYNWGASLSRESYKLRANWNYRGRDRNNQITGRGIEPGTFVWESKRLYLDLSGEYALSRRLALFANLRNVLDAGDDRERAGPSTPPHAQLQLREYWGSLWTFGVKGSF